MGMLHITELTIDYNNIKYAPFSSLTTIIASAERFSLSPMLPLLSVLTVNIASLPFLVIAFLMAKGKVVNSPIRHFALLAMDHGTMPDTLRDYVDEAVLPDSDEGNGSGRNDTSDDYGDKE